MINHKFIIYIYFINYKDLKEYMCPSTHIKINIFNNMTASMSNILFQS